MWWQHEGILAQWLRDFLRDALRRRGINALLSDQPIAPEDLLGDPRRFGFASLDMVQLASRFAVCLGLDKTGLSDLLLARRSAPGWCEVARRSLQINDGHIGFYSSGSTASPVLNRHALAALSTEADFFANTLLQRIACRRVVSTVPAHHIYGFIWGVLLPQQRAASAPLFSDAPVFIDTGTRLPTSWVNELTDNDLIVATPDTWKLLADLRLPLPKTFIGISSTAALPAQVAQYFNAHFPDAMLVEVYGSTETAGLGWRCHHHEAFTLLPWWQLQQQRHGEQLSTTAICSRTGESYLLQDKIEQVNNNLIRVHGRQDAVIQIAGHNINLDTLAAALANHPDVYAAKVNWQQQDGQIRLHYFLAINAVTDAATHWCRAFSDWLVEHLGDVPPPASVVLSSTLPQSSLGKQIVWEPEHYPVLSGIYRGHMPAITTAR